MQARLQAAGVRPISNIVDVTNYVLLELGQPMHAFDLAKLGGGADSRAHGAVSGEQLRTLDGQVRDAVARTCWSSPTRSGQWPSQASWAARDSEVSAGTTAIVLESAYFNPLSVRRTSKALGLKTEASMRFERGADPRLR